MAQIAILSRHCGIKQRTNQGQADISLALAGHPLPMKANYCSHTQVTEGFHNFQSVFSCRVKRGERMLLAFYLYKGTEQTCLPELTCFFSLCRFPLALHSCCIMSLSGLKRALAVCRLSLLSVTLRRSGGGEPFSLWRRYQNHFIFPSHHLSEWSCRAAELCRVTARHSVLFEPGCGFKSCFVSVSAEK